MRRGAPARRSAGGDKAGPGQASATTRPADRATASTRDKAAIVAWVRILAVHKRGLATIRDDLEREMTLPRFDLLASLTRVDGQTLASLSRNLLVTAGNLTGLVDRAARDGLVERRADPSDRRAWRVHLTPKGQRTFKNAERRHAARVTKIFESFTPAEVATLTRLLDKLRAELRAPEPPPRGSRAVRPHAEPGGPAARRRTKKKTSLE